MICKQVQCSSARAGILYAGNKKESEMITSNDCYGTPEEIAKQFDEVQKYNTRTAGENKTYHVVIGVNEEDNKKLTEYDKKEMVEEFAKKMGFENNQYVVYEHRDSNSPHYHFIGNRIDDEGKAVSLSNNYYKHEEYSREQEKKYNLEQVLTKDRTNVKEQTISLSNHRKEELRTLIDKNIEKSSDMAEFKKNMERDGIKVYQGRGLSYQDKDKALFKGSDIGKQYSLQHTERRLEKNREKSAEMDM